MKRLSGFIIGVLTTAHVGFRNTTQLPPVPSPVRVRALPRWKPKHLALWDLTHTPKLQKHLAPRKVQLTDWGCMRVLRSPSAEQQFLQGFVYEPIGTATEGFGLFRGWLGDAFPMTGLLLS